MENYQKAYQIFKDAGWFEFFQRLEGSNKVIAMEFANNLKRNQTKVRGLQLEVTKEVISHVMTLPIEGKRWFNRKINDPSLKEDFFQGEEWLVTKGRGIDRLLLPQPWEDATLYLIKYITCEGREKIVFNYHFPLLNHAQHQQMIKLP